MDSAGAAVLNRAHEVILTAVVVLVVPRVQMAVISITGSLGLGSNSVVQYTDRRLFSGNTKDTPFMTASSPTDFNTTHSSNGQTQKTKLSRREIIGIKINLCCLWF